MVAQARRFAALSCFMLGLAACERPAPKPPEARRPRPSAPLSYTLDAFDVGTGLAILVRGDDFAVLYDGGSNDDRKTGVDNRLIAYLALTLGPPLSEGCVRTAAPASKPRDIGHLFVSHPHRDHIALLPDVLRCFHVAEVWESGKESDTEGAELLDAAITAAGSERHVGGSHFSAGHSIPFGRGARAIVLSVRPEAGDPNDASIVLRLELDDATVLLPGDAMAGERAADPSEAPAPRSVEAELLRERNGELDADVLVVGHHGSLTSTRAAFLDAVNPSIAIISSGPAPYGKNRVILPDPEVVSLLANRKIEVLRTDRDDRACVANTNKVGNDADDRPGGCDAVRVVFESGKPPRSEAGPLSD